MCFFFPPVLLVDPSTPHSPSSFCVNANWWYDRMIKKKIAFIVFTNSNLHCIQRFFCQAIHRLTSFGIRDGILAISNSEPDCWTYASLGMEELRHWVKRIKSDEGTGGYITEGDPFDNRRFRKTFDCNVIGDRESLPNRIRGRFLNRKTSKKKILCVPEIGELRSRQMADFSLLDSIMMNVIGPELMLSSTRIRLTVHI